MGVVIPQLIGRFGNQLFQYAFARGYAEKHGHRFECPDWIGAKIFALNDAEPSCDPWSVTEGDLTGQGDVKIIGYGQNQACIEHYTRKKLKEWFQLRPAIAALLGLQVKTYRSVAHYRCGDYLDLGYVVVSKKSYLRAHDRFGFGSQGDPLYFVQEETPARVEGLPDFLPDFYTLMSARVLFRGNSSFSWWAAALSDASIFSPVITGKKGGQIQECEFVSGNHPKFADLPNITDLLLRDE